MKKKVKLSSLMRFRALAFFAVLGPGFITANVDNDPGGILTYSQAGAKFGYALLWTLIPTTIALIVVQEMAARMGAVTGKGLSDLIREEFGLRATFFTLLCSALPTSAISRRSSPALLRALVSSGFQQVSDRSRWSAARLVGGSARIVQVAWNELLLLFSLIYFTYPISAFVAHPDWHQALLSTFMPSYCASPTT